MDWDITHSVQRMGGIDNTQGVPRVLPDQRNQDVSHKSWQLNTTQNRRKKRKPSDAVKNDSGNLVSEEISNVQPDGSDNQAERHLDVKV
jgi:hypothetical protein